MSNIFNKLSTPKPVKSNKKDFSVIYPKDIDQSELFDLIKDFDELGKENKKLTTKVNGIKEKLRKIGLDEYLNKYQEDGENPGSILIEAKSSKNEDDFDFDDIDTDDSGTNIGQYLFVPQDRYITIKTEKEANDITDKYGDIIDRSILYSIDPKMLDKYASVISELIENSDDIEHEDKGKLFISTETYSIKKGTIDNLNLSKDEDIKDVFESIKPVVSIKDAKIIKS